MYVSNNKYWIGLLREAPFKRDIKDLAGILKSSKGVLMAEEIQEGRSPSVVLA